MNIPGIRNRHFYSVDLDNFYTDPHEITTRLKFSNEFIKNASDNKTFENGDRFVLLEREEE